MSDASPDRWWRHRRFIWPLACLLMLLSAFIIAIASSGVSRVVVHNETGMPIDRLTISATGSSNTFLTVADGESVTLRLKPGGGEGDVLILTNGGQLWRGDYIESSGGYRVTVRIHPNGEILSASSISPWQKMLR